MTPTRNYAPGNASKPEVVQARALQDWSDVPTATVKLSEVHATEEAVKSKHIDKILAGEPLRAGYDPKVVRARDGKLYVADGNTRMAIYAALGKDKIKVQILDLSNDALIAACYDKSCAPPPVGDGGSSKGHIAAHRHATKILSKAKEAENVVTPSVSKIVAAAGGEMVGLEHRLKSLPSLRRKIHDKAKSKGIEIKRSADNISDALRYTGVVPTAKYSQAVSTAVASLKADGFKINEIVNYWPSGDDYNGLHVIAQHPNGSKVELQFHTPESIAAKGETHKLYEIARADDTTPQRRLQLANEMQSIADAAPLPNGALDIGTLTTK